MAESAGVSVKPPKCLEISNDLNMKQEWKNWEQQFRWYAIATQLDKRSPEIQVATFMSTIGPDAAKIYNTFKLTDDQTNDIKVIQNRFEKHFVPEINVTYERYVFNKTSQRQGESFDEFLTMLKSKCKNCEFGELENSLICDKIVIGIADDQVREKLLTEKKLTLQKAMDICRASEMAKIHLNSMKDTEMQQVNVVKSKRHTEDKSGKRSQTEVFNCKRCGTSHGKRACPAYNKTCSNCKKKHHFTKCCLQKTTSNVSAVDTKVDPQMMYVTSVDASTENDWFEQINLSKNKACRFKLDTGAQCNVITSEIAKSAGLKVTKSNVKTLVSFSSHSMQVIGEAVTKINHKGRTVQLKLLVVNEQAQPILGKDTCVQLGLIKRLQSLNIQNEIFEGIGCLKGFTYEIDLVDEPKLPICNARRIPHALREQVKKELDEMVKNEIIEPIQEPTPSVSPMVVVQRNGKTRICLDPSVLNKNLKRRHFPLNTLEEIAARISGSKFFTLLDCKKGFWQIKVTPRTAKYLTFATPWGRFACLRMPFGLASAPEVFQQIMSHLVTGIPNVEVSMDDILIHASTQDNLDKTTNQVMQRLNDAGLKLNRDKCIFAKQELTFLGHVVTDKGLRPHPDKIEAISRVRTPTSVKELQRFLGMVTYQAKFLKNLADMTAPLRILLEKDKEWAWDSEQEQAFQQIKESLNTITTLSYFNHRMPVMLSVDASKDAVGAVLLQDSRPIAYSAKALTKTQCNWSQLEKEAYAILTACKKFHDYIWGSKNLIVESDHKPLEAIFKKPLNEAPPRLQRILYEVIPYNPLIKYKKGTELYIADTLSRDCNNKPPIEEESTLQIQVVIPMTKERLLQLKEETSQNPELNKLSQIIMDGWPNRKSDLPEILQKYWHYREQLSYMESIIFKNNRILIPPNMIDIVMKSCHLSHKGVENSLRMARDYVFWPTMKQDLQNYIEKCKPCKKLQKDNPREQLLLQDSPELPWQIVATDIATVRGNDYLIIADSYSGFFDFVQLGSIQSRTIIRALKSWFALHGTPQVLLSDCGTQFTSQEFATFQKQWAFDVRQSSPHFARSNGLAERYVQEAKNLIAKCLEDSSDIQLALLHHRNTPRNGLGSPVQRLMSRRTRTTLPTTTKLLTPEIVHNVKEKIVSNKIKEKLNADRGKKPEKKFLEGDHILYRNKHKEWLPAVIKEKAAEPRSYIIQTPEGVKYRRNSWFLKEDKTPQEQVKEPPEENSTQQTILDSAGSMSAPQEIPRESQASVPPTITRSGRTIRPPERLDL